MAQIDRAKQSSPRYHNIDVSFESPTSSGKAIVHYIEAGVPSAQSPTLVLYHGFPSSSTQYRNLIPLLSDDYHVLALDFPGFGLTKVPDDFVYSFENLAAVTVAWLEALKIEKYVMYVFDYGAPVGLRIALQQPENIVGIITQNGNTFEEGFGKDFWAPIVNIWETANSDEARTGVAEAYLTLGATEYQYTVGVPDADLTLRDPQAWHSDYVQNVAGPDNQRHQLDLFYDYRTNVLLYPKFQAYFRESGVPILVAWGKNDPCFIYPGAEKFKQFPNAKVHLLDTGHFALETKRWEIAGLIKAWLKETGLGG